MRTRVKICGITREQDAAAVVQAGADALGLVFYPKSPRHVTLDQAWRIATAVAPFVTVTGLFVNATAEHVREVLASVPLGLLQFHGQDKKEVDRQCENDDKCHGGFYQPMPPGV